jgi:hypothetical protein
VTEKNHLWKIKFADKTAVFVSTGSSEHEDAIELATVALFGEGQASFKGLEPEHPLEKLEYLGTVIT